MKKDPVMTRYLRARQDYETGDSDMSDAEYDALEAQLKKKYPNDPLWKETGAPVCKKTSVMLPRYMPSLNKKYPDDLKKSRNDVYDIVMPKFDGCAVQMNCNRKAVKAIYTRGDGVEGKDISFLIPYLQLPRPIDDAIIRCEAILTKGDFDYIVAQQKKQGVKEPYRLARNAVAGLLNATTKNAQPEFLKLIRFVIISEYDRQLGDLPEWGVEGWDVVPRMCKVKASDLESLLESLRSESFEYEVDGLVVVPKDKKIVVTKDKPDDMWAFKVNADAVQTKVTKIVWDASRFGIYAPTVHIEPVVIAGSKISKLTGHNYEWLKSRKLGVGSTVAIVKAGDVIPYLSEVLTTSSDMCLPVNYEVDGVHIVVPDGHAADNIMVKRIEHFLDTMGVEGFKAKSIEAMFSVLPNISSYLFMWQDRSYDQVAEVLGDAAADSLEREMEKAFDRPDLLRYMKAVGLFKADSSLDDVVAVHGTQEVLLNLTDAKLRRVTGWADKKIEAVLSNMVPWLATVECAESAGIVFNMQYIRKGQTVCFTGYRSKEEVAILEAAGYSVLEKYTSKCNILLYKKGQETDKVRKHKNAMQFSQLNLRK